MYERSSQAGSFIFGSLIGLAIGGILGIIFAPRPGKETREQLMDKYQEMKDKAREKAKEMTDRTKQTFEESKSKTRRAGEAARKELEE